ncbi:hypothetical protein DPMN_179371 [Dreissena polymorpha]|uniref:Uncharacterized protein n=1 Tax=Dreissena polymorpha TaxID=45954 RepID=A0A9D4IMA2_DREPO|nr:hypothetical protein DPMN_179371 [Dreissena polymorpha]
MRGNTFKTLSDQAIVSLSNVPAVMVDMRDNHFKCSECSDMTDVERILSVNARLLESSTLQCTTGTAGSKEYKRLDLDRLNSIRNMCTSMKLKKNLILYGFIFSTATFTVIVLVICILRRRNKVNLLRQKMMANLELFANDATDIKFAALLIFSSADEVFVDDSIYGPLNQTLQQLTGINRNLIATGTETLDAAVFF